LTSVDPITEDRLCTADELSGWRYSDN